MPFNPKISPLIIENIASAYPDIYKVVMEYIDNSIDAATKINPTSKEVTYQNTALISIEISRKTDVNKKIKISDNCKGIPNLKEILEKIGNSSKKLQSWTNGTFGFGIYAFMAVCEKLQISTKVNGTKILQNVTITRNDFKKDDISDVYINITEEEDDNINNKFTEITLSEFDKDKWNDFEATLLQHFINIHFELVLNRVYLPIQVTIGKKAHYCLPYLYNAIEGDIFEKEMQVLDENGVARTSKIFLKYTAKKVTERSIAFFSKDRRIAKVNEIKLFHSDRRLQIWSNPQLIGYIDTRDILTPTIIRDSFKNNILTKRLFRKIKSLEPEILEFIDKCNQDNKSSYFESIENVINGKINATIKEKQKIKRKPRAGDNAFLANKWGYLMECIEYKKFDLEKKLKRTSIVSNPNVLNSNNENLFTADNYEIKQLYVKPVNDYSVLLNVKIEATRNPLVNENNTEILSVLEGSTLLIFKKHKDFDNRIKKNLRGEEFISTSLISLIIIEFLSHFLKNLPEPRKTIEFKEHYYLLEKELSELSGKPLISYS